MVKNVDPGVLPPKWIIGIISSFRNALLKLNHATFPGNVVLYEQFQSFWLLPCLYVAAKLDIANLLRDNPMNCHEIALKANADASAIGRIMRALSSQGIFRQSKDGRYKLNPMAKGLLDGRGSLRFLILHHLGPVNWNVVGNLERSVFSGGDAFTELYGTDPYTFMKDHPDENNVFDRSMSDLSDMALDPLLKAFNFSSYKVIADIGGGEGFFLKHILKRSGNSRGILFDAPETLKKAMEQAGMSGRHEHSTGAPGPDSVSKRITVIGGDFFKEIPVKADLYILKNVIHNWNDENSIRILSNIASQMNEDSRLLIIEMIVPEGNKSSLAKMLDIQMLVSMPGGKERTEREFRAIIGNSGLRLNKVITTIAPLCILEIRKI